MNAEFQRISWRDKKAFLSDQCKEIEDNNRMRKIRDLFKKIRDTQRIFHAKMGTNKGQKWYGPNRTRRYEEVARIHRRTIQKRYSWCDLELDIRECKVTWALGSITANKASGGDEIPAELFQILKDDAVKVLHSIASKFGKLSSGYRTGKGQFSFQLKERHAKECSNYYTTALISHLTK